MNFFRLAVVATCVATAACDESPPANGYRDLNKNGRLDVYEDVTQAVDARIDDLLSQMSVAEKAGLMFINISIVNDDATLEYIPGSRPERLAPLPNIDERKLNHFNVGRIPDDPAVFAQWQNNLQRYAERNTRLGIPVTIASDPRHHFSTNIYAFSSIGFSQFPETLGLAAIGDIKLVERFTDIVRQEYVAVGIRLALHPQVDLATEPRWSRINGGFGADAQLSADIAGAYVRGLQGNSLTAASVAAMTKHFPGGGPQAEGLDPHFVFQKGQVYPGGMFDYHLLPFEAAIKAGTAAIMPYYGVPTGQTSKDVGMSFNKDIISGLLREKYGYDGVVCADWGIITDRTMSNGYLWPGRAWGVEHLSRAERIKKALDAGIDQFGGETASGLVVDLVESGELSEARIDISARRMLRLKFELGLFNDPYVDVDAVTAKVGTAEARLLGHESQMRAMTLLKNGSADAAALPLPTETLKVYVEGIDSSAVSEYAAIADSPQEADVAILRVNTPWYPVESDNPFAQGFHHGDLDFNGARKQKILDLLQTVPTIVVIYLDRPAVIPEIVQSASAVIADYGASDRAVAEVLFGIANPQGSLPFELPSSMEAVRNQYEDVPRDSQSPLFESGFGLDYRQE
jgi:beta-glucosidase